MVNGTNYGLGDYDVRNQYRTPNVGDSVNAATSSIAPVTPTVPQQSGVLDGIRRWWDGQGTGGGVGGTNSSAPLMSRGIANASAIGNLGLGLAGYLENRKTAGLQREALRNDISTAKEHRANRQALGESWNNAWS